MDKYREEFEKEMQTFGFGEYENDFKINEETGEYIIQDLNAMLAGFKIGWKASRESMKAIKFPDELVPEYEGDGYKSRYDAAYCNGYNEALRLVDDSITSAGYKVE